VKLTCHSPRLAKIQEMKRISESPLPIEIYTKRQNRSIVDYRKKGLGSGANSPSSRILKSGKGECSSTPWLVVIQAGFPPAGLRGLAGPQPMADLFPRPAPFPLHFLYACYRMGEKYFPNISPHPPSPAGAGEKGGAKSRRAGKSPGESVPGWIITYP
jgi:hypothetical protein